LFLGLCSALAQLPTVDGGPEDDGGTSVAAGLAQTTRKTKMMAGSSPSWYSLQA